MLNSTIAKSFKLLELIERILFDLLIQLQID
jgi:hypothetical protein